MSIQTSVEPPFHIIVLCHPEQESFNASVAAAYSSAVRQLGHRSIVRDLYSMGFQPVLKSTERPGPDFHKFPDVEQELGLIRSADVFVLVYPLWFGTPPAMMKGYVERVLGTGATPGEIHDRSAKGTLSGKQMISFTTSATSDVWLDEQGQLQSLLNGFDHYIEHAFSMKPSRHLHFGHVVKGMSARFGGQHLSEVREYAHAVVTELNAERTTADAAISPS